MIKKVIKNRVSFRLSDDDINRIDLLSVKLKETKVGVIRRALEIAYYQEIKGNGKHK